MTLRSKSTSHILEIQTAHNKKKLQENSTSTEDKYKTYTVDDFIERRKRFSGNINDESKKIQSVNRSQNFVKKIIASFENKNEACTANDEFFTRYYRSNNRKLEIKNNETEIPPVSSVETSKICSEEFACSNTETGRKAVLENCTESNNSLKSITETFNNQENNFKINEKDRKHCKRDYVQCDSKNDIEVCNYERRACYDPSTFDPRRDRVELQNRIGVMGSYISESDPNNRKGNTLERICKFEFTSLKMERDSRRSTSKKGFKGRNKFFKCFFGSVIKWRRSEVKDRSQRFFSQIMQEFPYVLSEYEEINPLLYKPINSTQRIKYTCFNTSPNYIVLGSTSGSIYLFSRKPCSFIQLIPLSEGAVSCVLISPDEKTIALTTIRGLVCLVALKPMPKLIAISSEHIHKQVNCLCWNDNCSELYIGDENGKVSVMVLSIFTVNGMFQAPACTLMNLDSTIVQLSFSSPLLLVSTLTRCYICDTIQEHYKQVGNKARNGEFESNSKEQDENFPQIFCARPGSRLWEVSANGIVMKTHQFKEAFAISPTVICRPNIRKLIYQKQTEQIWLPQSINFSHLFVIAEKYLFSYTSTGLYIIDPLNATVVLWNNEFSNIIFAETIENKIYLMTSDGEFHCLVLSLLDSLISRLYSQKKYYECLEICLMYKVQLKKLIKNSEINNICDIENRIFRDDELSTLIHPLILSLESNVKIVPKKLDSEKKTSTNLLNDNKVKRDEDTNCNTAEEIEESQEETKEILNSNKSITQRIQADLEIIYALVGNIRPLMDEEELEKIILDIDWRMNVIKDSYENLDELKNFVYEVLRSVELYYFNVLLENVSIQLIQSTDNENIIKQIMKTFVNVNTQSCRKCTCGSVYSMKELIEPKFLEIGRSLLKKMLDECKEHCISLCYKIPYMWREFLPLYTEQHGIMSNDLIRQCLQTRDNIVFSILLPLLDGKHWNYIATYTKEIQEGQCLFCGKSMKRGNHEEWVNWTAVIYEIMKKQGPDIAMTLLIKLEKAIPNIHIDRSIFQSLVFTKLLYHHGMKCTINFNKNNLESSEYDTICSTKIQDQLVEVLKKDLNKVINKNVFENGPHHWGMRYQNKLSTCSCCTLSLQTPVLLGNNGIAIFDCGHAYHMSDQIVKDASICIKDDLKFLVVCQRAKILLDIFNYIQRRVQLKQQIMRYITRTMYNLVFIEQLLYYIFLNYLDALEDETGAVSGGSSFTLGLAD
ncbi:Hermansky-Pudlak syndrome 5 protein like protein [Melipona quadrifasciata]|uniref:Hermansky-Pudlak syndrome 5 protein like protein n=1 Tax=Melipona quadrifasciata TaxID=166423 RepID=A0A0M9A5P7_9HYME|nr:Hermansky-Pudlak syndrome 5 protein like protein [Melipona quadrifasciata]